MAEGGAPAVNEFIPDPLDYFAPANINQAYEDRVRDKINPISGFDGRDGGSLKFIVHGTDWFLDTTEIYVAMKLQLDGATTGTSVKTPKFADIKDTQLSVINNIGHSMFQGIRVKLGNQNVNPHQFDYAYTANHQIFLTANTTAQRVTFRNAGFLADTPGEMDTGIDATTPENTGNKALYARRQKFFDENGVGEFIIKPHTGLCFADKHVPPYLDLELELIRHENPHFYLMHGATGNFKIRILEAKLWVRKLKVKLSLVAGLEKALAERRLLRFTLTESIVNTFSIPKDTLTYHNDTLFHGKIPLRIVIGTVESEAYMGDRTKNPFNFQHFRRTHTRLLKNGVEYPEPEIITNFPTGGSCPTVMEAFHVFLDSINAIYSNDGPEITLEDYPRGYFLTSYNMAPDGRGALDVHNSAYKPSNIRLELKFGAALAKVVQLIVYAEVLTQVAIDYKRTVAVTQQ